MANSSKFVLPKQTQPEDHNLLEAVDSYGETKLLSILLAQVVATPLVQILSLIAIGIPARGGRISSFSINLSIFSAWAIALSFVVQI